MAGKSFVSNKYLLDDYRFMSEAGFFDSHPDVSKDDYDATERELIYPVICDQLGWGCAHHKQGGDIYCEVSQYSPAGEDFSFTVWFDGTTEDFITAVRDYYEAFDPEDHVKMWLCSNMRGVPDAFTLVKDAKEIDEMLRELAEALEKGIVETGEPEEDAELNRVYWNRMEEEMDTAVARIADYSDPKIDRYILGDYRGSIVKEALALVVKRLENIGGKFPLVSETEE